MKEEYLLTWFLTFLLQYLVDIFPKGFLVDDLRNSLDFYDIYVVEFFLTLVFRLPY